MIVVARGGGSVEDLLPFSDEALIRAVHQARTPVVSAIGHEPDQPLLDLVADVRASTPTDAAKLVVPDVAEELRRRRPAPATGSAPAVAGCVAREQAGLDALRSRPALADPRTLVDARADEVDAAARPRPPLPVARASTGPPTTSATSAPAPARCRRWPPCSAGYAVLQDADGHVVSSRRRRRRPAPTVARPGRRRPHPRHHHRGSRPTPPRRSR